MKVNLKNLFNKLKTATKDPRPEEREGYTLVAVYNKPNNHIYWKYVKK